MVKKTFFLLIKELQTIRNPPFRCVFFQPVLFKNFRFPSGIILIGQPTSPPHISSYFPTLRDSLKNRKFVQSTYKTARWKHSTPCTFVQATNSNDSCYLSSFIVFFPENNEDCLIQAGFLTFSVCFAFPDATAQWHEVMQTFPFYGKKLQQRVLFRIPTGFPHISY